jgi:hypothetical protein
VIGTRSFALKLLTVDGGMAFRPFGCAPQVEFRLGSENKYDVQLHELETGLYGAARFIF